MKPGHRPDHEDAKDPLPAPDLQEGGRVSGVGRPGEGLLSFVEGEVGEVAFELDLDLAHPAGLAGDNFDRTSPGLVAHRHGEPGRLPRRNQLRIPESERPQTTGLRGRYRDLRAIPRALEGRDRPAGPREAKLEAEGPKPEGAAVRALLLERVLRLAHPEAEHPAVGTGPVEGEADDERERAQGQQAFGKVARDGTQHVGESQEQRERRDDDRGGIGQRGSEGQTRMKARREGASQGRDDAGTSEDLQAAAVPVRVRPASRASS